MNTCTLVLAATLAASLGFAAELVTIDSFIRAETHFYMKGQVDSGCFGSF